MGGCMELKLGKNKRLVIEEVKENNLELSYVKRNLFEKASSEVQKEIFDFAEKYKKFLNTCKTERECSRYILEDAKKHGFKEFKFGDALKAGDKRYFVNRNKGVVLFNIGKNDLETNGIRLVVAHIDSPRIDIKQVPLYESDGMCFLKTHYYGGIKKYQWTAMPLSLHGVVILKNGKKVEINVGEKEGDPVFYINDLLPHLGSTQMSGTANNLISGEQLNVVIGGMPLADVKNDKIKNNILKLLNKEYGIIEEDFISAELSAVPAMKACDVGFDRSLIGGYGHDDRSSVYPAYQAILNANADNTNMCILVDKEEIGSEGNTGMKSKVYEDLIEEICFSMKANVRAVRQNSICLSADVTAGYDPNFANVFEKKNSALLSCGTCMCKFSGSRGKSGSSDASAETVGKIRKIFDENDVYWQTAELGKVDLGGGGTVAMFIAQLNIDTVDIGVPVISMHAPYELISKADLYSMYTACQAFYK